MAHILIADDKADVVSWMRVVLEREGHHVTATHNGDLGLSAFLETPDLFDLVILDEAMPFRNGREVAEAIRQSGATEVPILFYSAHNRPRSGLEQEAEEKALQVFAPCFSIPKGAPEDLLAQVRQILFIHPPRHSARPAGTQVLAEASEASSEKRRERAPLWAKVLIAVVAANAVAQWVSVYRAQYSFAMIASTHAYVAKATGTSVGGTVMEARIPYGVGALPPLRKSDGQQDIVLRVAPEDAQKARQLAQKRGVRLRVEVR